MHLVVLVVGLLVVGARRLKQLRYVEHDPLFARLCGLARIPVVIPAFQLGVKDGLLYYPDVTKPAPLVTGSALLQQNGQPDQCYPNPPETAPSMGPAKFICAA